MKPHDTFLELAAIAMDFPLTPVERGRLEQHLAGCATCGRTVHGLRGDALALSQLPPVTLPERRGAEILAAALHPPVVRNPVRLLVVAALLGLLLLGSLAVGSELLRRMDQDELGVVLPVPTVSASPEAGPSGSPGVDNGVGMAWKGADLPNAEVPETGGATMGGVITGGPGAIAWGWAYGLPPRIWTTTDGRAWESATVEIPADPDPDVKNPGTISGIAAGGPGFVAVGWYDVLGAGRRGLVWTSVDGRTWDLVPHDTTFEHVIIDDVVALRGELLAYGQEEAGSDESAGRQLLWTSRDGMTWQREALSMPGTFRANEPIVSGDGLWALGGPTNYDINAGWRQTRWLTSTDGRTWSESSLPRYPGMLYPLPGRLLTLLLPFPTSGDSAPPDAADRPAPGLYRSTDGSSWEPLSEGPAVDGYDLIEVGGTLVIVGDDAAGDPQCWADCQAMSWRSLDRGATWQAVPTDVVGGTMLSVAALADGTLVSVGRLLDDRGSPSPAAWVSIPAARPTEASPSPSASPAPGGNTSPAETLVVTRGEGDARAIEILTPDGRTTRLAEGWDPAWLPSDTIIYTCPNSWVRPGVQPGQSGICAVNLRAPATPQVLIAEAYGPVPAPDGRSVAIHRGMIDVGETWIMAADGSNPRLLRSGWFPQWSPDGAWLAGQPETPGDAEVAIVGADGQGFRVLAPGYDPSWSPTGQRIAFAVVEGDVASLRTVDVSSGAVEIQHTAPAGEEVSAPVFLAEGRIAFVQDGNVWIFDSSGARAIMSGHAIEGSPSGDPLAVSPNGSRIAFTHGTGPEAIVEIREINGGNEVYPANGSGPVTQPVWAPWNPTSQPSDGSPTGTASPGATPAVGGGGQLGDTWVAAQMPVVAGRPVGRIEAVTAGGPGFVAVGRGCVNTGADLPTCEGVVWTSIDGKAWLRTPAGDPTDTGAFFPTSGPEIGMFDVAAGGPGIVAIGYAARPDLAATIWFSSDDGASWERAKIGDVGTTRVNAVTWDGRQFVMVGEDRSQWDGTLEGMDKASARAAVWTSTDGYTFTRVPHSEVFDVGEFLDTMEDPSTGGMKDVVAGPAGLVAVGSVCTAKPAGCKPMAWTSADGITWERAVAMQAADDQAVIDAGLTSVAASDDRYVAAAGNWVLTSSDGRSWARSSYLDGAGWGYLATVHDRFFARTGYGVKMSSGSDGASWIALEVNPWVPGTEVQGVRWHFAATAEIAVAVGSPWTDAGTDEAPMAMVSVGK